jgi:predicted nucleic acid-binding protein
MMAYLLDTNLLLRSIDAGHPMQAVAVNAVASLLARGEQVFITPQNLIEFWAVATRPAERNGLGLTAGEAHAELVEIENIFRCCQIPPASMANGAA